MAGYAHGGRPGGGKETENFDDSRMWMQSRSMADDAWIHEQEGLHRLCHWLQGYR